jgi:signal transduction histidine kinase/putative methionine-R-sulfoxide reductase with GAF domain
MPSSNAIEGALQAADELSKILPRIARSVGANDTRLFLLRDAETLVLVADSNGVIENQPRLTASVRDLPAEFTIEDVRAHALNVPIQAANGKRNSGVNFKTSMLAPLLSFDSRMAGPSGIKIGYLEAVRETPDTFNEHDLELLEVSAGWVAHTVGRVDADADDNRRLKESAAMAAISRALSGTLDLDEVLQLIVDLAGDIIPQVEQAVIHLLSEDGRQLQAAAVTGQVKNRSTGIGLRPGEGIAGLVMKEGITLNVGDTRRDPRFISAGGELKMRSLLVAPVQSRQDRLGTISVQSGSPNAFSPEDGRLLSTLGLQAALALENARLYDAQRIAREQAEHQAAELAANANFLSILNEITRAGMAQPNSESLLEMLANRLGELYNGDGAYLTRWDPETRTASLVAANFVPSGDSIPIKPQAGERTLTESVLDKGHPIAVPDVSDSPYLNKSLASRFPAKSLLGLPLIANDVQVGAALIGFNVERHFSELEIAQGEVAARQIALTISNIDLLEAERSARLDAERLRDELSGALENEQTVRARLVQAEKLSSMGKMVASVAHELNNPLQGIQNVLYLVGQDANLSDQSREDLNVMTAEADRMADLINRLRETYRPVRASQFSAENLNLILLDVQKLTATYCRHQGVQFEFTPDPRLPHIAGIFDQIKQVILNLALNAVDAMPEGGRLMIETQAVADHVRISVIDSGPGIPQEDIPHVFDPFFTTKEKGTGLGLSITYDIVKQHLGEITVRSKPGQTVFEIELPIANPNPNE